MANNEDSPNSAVSKNSAATVLEPSASRNPISFNAAAFPVILTPNNYISWKAQFISLVDGYELDGFLDGTNPCPVATDPGYGPWARQDRLLRHALICPVATDPGYGPWARQDRLLRHALITSVSDSLIPYIAAVTTVQEGWETLARLFANRSRTRVITLKERLQNMKRDGKPVSEYLRSLKSIADELGTIDHPLSDDDLTIYVLNGLGPEFREIAASLRIRDSSLTFDDLHDRLVAHEESLKREESVLLSTPVTANFASAHRMLSSPSVNAGYPSSSNPGFGQHPSTFQNRSKGFSQQNTTRPNQWRRRGSGPRNQSRPNPSAWQ